LLTILIGGCLLGLLGHALRRRQLPRPIWSIALPFGIFVAYAGFSVGWSIIPESTLGQFFKLAYLFGAAFLCAAILSDPPPEARLLASRALIAGTVLGLAVLLFDTAAGYPLLRAVHGADSSGHVGDPAVNRTVVAIATLIWPAALALNARAPAYSLTLPIGFLGISIFTTSQSATFGILVGLLTYAIACWSTKVAQRLVLGALLVGFLGAVPIARAAYSLGLSEAAWLPHSAQHRIEVWNFAAERVARRPITGFGLDSSRAVPNEGDVSKFESWTDRVIPLHTHNVFLQLWLELGAIGAALGFAIGAALLRAVSALDQMSRRFALAAFACNLAMAGVTSFSMWQTWWTSALILSALFLLPGARPAVFPANHDRPSQ
jgi:O-antigen ligase